MKDVAVQDQTALHEAVRALRDEVARLADRITALEAAVPAAPVTAGPTPSQPPAPSQPAAPAPAAAPPALPAAPAPEMSEELLLVISAAIAAFLGKKPYIRQIRLVSSPTWTQQARVNVQTLHAIPMHYRAGASA